MAQLIKLTNAKWETRGPTRWGPNVTHGPLSGEGGLCGPGWYHAYTSLELALMLNPIHANIANPVAWLAEGEIGISDNGLKVGCRSLTTIRIVEQPTITTEHRVRFGLLCSLKVCDNPSYARWANGWLSGEDRTVESARKAAQAAQAEAWAAAEAAEAAWAAASSGKPLDLAALAREAIYGDSK